MKKLFSMMLLCATVVLASCQKDDSTEPTPALPVSGITVNKTTLALIEGVKETLIATIAPTDAENKNVTWASSDVTVATVSTTGEVMAVKAGTAIITVTSVTDNTKTATCTVTVTKAIIPVSGVTLDQTTLSLKVGAKDTLVVTVAPNDATDNSVTWTSSDATVATVSETGEVTAVKAGTTTITVTSVADNTKTATCAVTVIAPAAVGDFYYFDKTFSSTYNSNKTCVGIVFWVDPTDGTKGKIISLDEAAERNIGIGWNEAVNWQSSKTLPSGMTWELPSAEDLQYFYCATIGIAPTTWTLAKVCPTPAVDGARAKFDALLTTAGGKTIDTDNGGVYYWSTKEVPSTNSMYGMSTLTGKVIGDGKDATDGNNARKIASF